MAVKNRKIHITREGLLEHNPKMFKDIDEIKHTLEVTCKKEVLEKYPKLNVDRIVVKVDISRMGYEYRILIKQALGQAFLSDNNSLESLTSLEDVRKEFTGFINNIDRLYYVR